MNKIFISLITSFLFFLPFFWFKPGEMDLGGDSSRLYFYDPLGYLTNYAFYGISPSAFGAENIGFFMVPFVGLLFCLKLIFSSPTFLIASFHGMSFSLAFLSCYFIVKDLINDQNKKVYGTASIAAIFAGLFYVFSQLSINGWDKVLVTHNQFFLNPFIFFLLFRYFRTSNTIYLLISLIISFLFSPNFSFAAAPPFFAFYPISIFFLGLYSVVILKKKIIWKHIMITCLVFLLLQSFHIIPQVMSMFSPGSVLNTGVFSSAGKFDRGLNYFISVAQSVKVSLNIMALPQSPEQPILNFLFIVFPAIVVVGLFFNKQKIVLLTAICFFMVLFFASANITNAGILFYKQLFNLPGFAIFRNFYGQWQPTLLFFYTLLLGQTLAIVLFHLKKNYRYFLSAGLFLLLVITAFPFITGELLNKKLWGSNMRIFTPMDTHYEETLQFIRDLPIDGKILTLPLTDPGYQILSGGNNGAYQGPSTIAYLAGKQDFSGIQEFGYFRPMIAQLLEDKEYVKLKALLGMLNIKYIFYNSDPNIYDKSFLDFPYSDVRKTLPKTQSDYKKFINELSLKPLKVINNKYYIFEIDDSVYIPKIFTTNQAYYFPDIVSDLPNPFSFEDITHRTIFFTGNEPSFTNATFMPLEKNIYSEILINPDPPQFLHNAYAKTKPSSIYYKPTIVKEFFELQKQSESDFVDARMFLSAKLIYEFELWGDEIPIESHKMSVDDLLREIRKKPEKRTVFWELEQTNNTWKALLTRYSTNFSETIDHINKSEETELLKYKKKLLVYNYIQNHRFRIANFIEGSDKSREEKVLLNELTDRLFETILIELQMPDLEKLPNRYFIPDIPKNLPVDLYIDKKSFEMLDHQLRIDQTTLVPSFDQDETNWVKFNTDGLKLGKSNLEIETLTPINIMDSAKVISIDSKNLDFKSLLDKDSKVTITNSLTMELYNIYPESYYLLSFDYLNDEFSFTTRLYTEVSEKDKNIEPKQLFASQLRSKKWTKYQAVFRTDKDIKRVFLQIQKDSVKQHLSKIEIKNIKMIYIPQPQIFIKINNTISQESLPNIIFTKINPTKYKVTVTNDNYPYYLVLQQAFNSGWKLYPASQPLETQKVVKNYFGDQFREIDRAKNLFDPNFLETFHKKTIYDDHHYTVNNYANAWYIDPKKLTSVNSHSFIIEMTLQQYFYIGAIISSITFIILIVYFIYRLIRKR